MEQQAAAVYPRVEPLMQFQCQLSTKCKNAKLIRSCPPPPLSPHSFRLVVYGNDSVFCVILFFVALPSNETVKNVFDMIVLIIRISHYMCESVLKHLNNFFIINKCCSEAVIVAA